MRCLIMNGENKWEHFAMTKKQNKIKTKNDWHLIQIGLKGD